MFDWLRKKLLSYRIMEMMDTEGIRYYIVEVRNLLKWEPLYSKTYQECDTDELKYALGDNIVRFTILSDAKELVWRISESQMKNGICDIVPLVYVAGKYHYFVSFAWCVPVDYLDNIDGYFSFAKRAYPTLEDAKDAVDKWFEEKMNETEKKSKYSRYRRVAYRF